MSNFSNIEDMCVAADNLAQTVKKIQEGRQ